MLPTVGVVSMQTEPPDLGKWLHHHKCVGVARVYLRLEGAVSEGVAATLAANRDWVDVVEHDVGAPEDTPAQNTRRQEAFVNRVLTGSHPCTVDWLVHIDDDELLFANSSLVAAFAAVPAQHGVVRIDNVEAVLETFDPDATAAFPPSQTVLFRAPVAAYANGKCACRVGVSNITARGAHTFVGGGQPFALPTRLVQVLHFECMSVAAWRRKFTRRAAGISDSELRHVPFAYYRESVAAVRVPDDCTPFVQYRTAAGHTALGHSPLVLRRILFDAYQQVSLTHHNELDAACPHRPPLILKSTDLPAPPLSLRPLPPHVVDPSPHLSHAPSALPAAPKSSSPKSVRHVPSPLVEWLPERTSPPAPPASELAAQHTAVSTPDSPSRASSSGSPLFESSPVARVRFHREPHAALGFTATTQTTIARAMKPRRGLAPRHHAAAAVAITATRRPVTRPSAAGRA